MSMIFKCDLCKQAIKPEESRMVVNISRPGYSWDQLGSFNHSWDICNECSNKLVEKLDKVGDSNEDS